MTVQALLSSLTGLLQEFGRFRQHGAVAEFVRLYAASTDPDEASILIVNTCGFIGPSREESIRSLRELAEGKSRKQTLIAAGCLSQIWGPKLVEEVPGIDGVIGTRRWMDIVEFTDKLRTTKHPRAAVSSPRRSESRRCGRAWRAARLRRRASARISKSPMAVGGPARSAPFRASRARRSAVRPKRSCTKRACWPNAACAKLILIAQDLTDYGHDLGLKDGLPTSARIDLRRRAGIEVAALDVSVSRRDEDRLIEVMATRPQIVHYVDIPLQHGHPEVLKRMRRPANIDWVYRTLEKIRVAMPDVAIRTTFIVGYPGETEAEFEGLLQFVRDLQFDRVGAFQYSFEPGTPSAELDGQMPDEVKQERYERLMEMQQAISLKKQSGARGPHARRADRRAGRWPDAGPHRIATRRRSTAW